MTARQAPAGWREDDSEVFLRWGHLYVPDRAEQIDTVVSLLPPDGDGVVLDLGSGAGLLSEAVLERHPETRVVGLDGSSAMRESAAKRLARFGARFRAEAFDLHDRSWRSRDRWNEPVRAVVSSLVVHHLDDGGKARLFRDLHELLEPGGALVIADLIDPAHPLSLELAARRWDEAVEEGAAELDDPSEAEAAVKTFGSGWNHYRTPDPIDTPSRLPDQLDWLREAGFTADVAYLRAGHAVMAGWKG